jgi:hypothetical protein
VKIYTVQFGTGDPRGFTGLAPTFLTFYNLSSGTTNTPPSISETISGKTGVYTFQYGVTQPISFLLDAATGIVGRYVVGQIDPNDRSDEYGNTMIAIGSTLIGYGNTSVALGTTSVALGTTSVAIGTTLIGYGVSGLALGTTAVALGVTSVAIGTTLLGFGASNLAIGTTLFGFGVSNLAIGNTLLGYGVTNVALGTTAVASGWGNATFIGQMGTTLVGIGNTAAFFGNSSALFSYIGSTASSFGSTSVDPSTLFGFLKRAQEFMEGNNTYTKATGVLDFYSRGSSTLLAEKTVSDTSTTTTKT